jgi:uncharacterized protein YybS (DUF2232 family)
MKERINLLSNKILVGFPILRKIAVKKAAKIANISLNKRMRLILLVFILTGQLAFWG